MASRGQVEIDVVANTSRFAAQVQRELKAALKGLHVQPVKVDADTKPLESKVHKAKEDIEKGLAGSFDKVRDRAGGAAKSIAAMVGSGAKISILTSAVAGLIPKIANLGSALAPATGALIALPGLVIGAAVAISVLKLGAAQLGEVVKTQATPAFEELQAIAGRELTAGLAKDIQTLVKVWLPTLKTGVKGISSAFNDMLHSAAVFAESKGLVKDWAHVFTNSQGAVEGMKTALASLLGVFTDLSIIGSDLLPGLGTALGEVLTRLQTFIHTARESGSLEEAFQGGLSTLEQIGGVLGQLGGIIAAVFKAAGTGGTGLLTTLEDLLGQVNAFLSAGEGKSVLVALFGTAGIVLDNLKAVLVALGPVLTNSVLPALESIAQAIAPVLPVIADALGKGLGALAPALQPLAAVVADVLTGLTPLLPVLGELLRLVGQLIQNGLSGLLAILKPIINALVSALGPALPKITEAFKQLAVVMVPIASQLGDALGQALTDLLPPILALIPTLVTQLAPAFADIAKALIQVLVALVPIIPPLVDLLVALVPLIPMIVQLAATLVTSLVPAVVPVIEAVVALATTIVNILVPVLTFLINYVVGPVISALGWLIEKLGAVLAAVTGFVSGLVKTTADIPNKIKSVFSSAGTWLTHAGEQIIYGLIYGINNKISALKNLLGRVTDLIPDWKGPEDRDRNLLRPAGQAIMQGLQTGIGDEQAALRRQLAGVTDQIAMTAAPAGVSGRVQGGDGAEAGGVRVWPSQPKGDLGTLTVVGDGSNYSELLIHELSKAVRVRGGNVQKVIGKTQGGVQ